MTRPYHKITSQELNEIVELYNSGFSSKQLGIKFSISRTNIVKRLNKLGIKTRSGKESQRTVSTKGIKHGPMSVEHRKRISESLTNNPLVRGRQAWNKGIKTQHNSGEKHWNWKGGTTPLHEQIRKSLEYKLWRQAVFERDNYTCVLCGDAKGGNLEADHIKQFAFYPELRFAIDNGRTLCRDCHKNTDTYGNNGIAR